MAGYRIYSLNGLGSSACAYYRIILPLNTMEQLGFPVECILDDGRATITQHTRASMFMESDITLIYQNVNPMTVKMMEAAKAFKPLKSTESSEVRWPPTFICDTDDDMFNVQPLNITYGRLGIKRPDGLPLKDGDEVGIAHPFDLASPETEASLTGRYPYPLPGTRGDITDLSGKAIGRYIFDEDGRWHEYISLWRDGGHNKNFDIKSNNEWIENWRQTLKQANLVTCSTPRSEAYVKREVPEANTFVTPNAIDFSAYPTIELREHPGEIRILWEGSATHHEGLWPVTEAIGRIADKYPQTTWHFFGAKYTWAAKHLPADRVKFIDWVPYESYKLRLSTLGHDICFSPLAPHIFNQSRSAIRWYESSAIWRPAATIAQNTAAYADEMEDGVTGMLFNDSTELETKMGVLIENASLRAELASNAKDWIRTNREVKQVVTKLFQKYVEVREGHKIQMPVDDLELVEVK